MSVEFVTTILKNKNIELNEKINLCDNFISNLSKEKLNEICIEYKYNKYSLLMYLALNNDYYALFEILLTKYKDKIIIDLQDKDGWTALIFASIDSNEKSVDLLIKAGADVNLQDKDGWTALIFASRNSNKKIVDLLIKAGADVNFQNKTGGTALIWASQNSDENIVDLLLKAGANVNLQNKNGNTALMYAKGPIKQLINNHLKHKSETLISKQQEPASQYTELAAQQKEFNEQRAAQQEEFNEQRTELAAQQKEFNEQREELAAQQKEFNEQRAELVAQQKELINNVKNLLQLLMNYIN